MSFKINIYFNIGSVINSERARVSIRERKMYKGELESFNGFHLKKKTSMFIEFN
jgi:hypothetical protein